MTVNTKTTLVFDDSNRDAYAFQVEGVTNPEVRVRISQGASVAAVTGYDIEVLSGNLNEYAPDPVSLHKPFHVVKARGNTDFYYVYAITFTPTAPDGSIELGIYDRDTDTQITDTITSSSDETADTATSTLTFTDAADRRLRMTLFGVSDSDRRISLVDSNPSDVSGAGASSDIAVAGQSVFLRIELNRPVSDSDGEAASFNIETNPVITGVHGTSLSIPLNHSTYIGQPFSLPSPLPDTSFTFTVRAQDNLASSLFEITLDVRAVSWTLASANAPVKEHNINGAEEGLEEGLSISKTYALSNTITVKAAHVPIESNLSIKTIGEDTNGVVYDSIVIIATDPSIATDETVNTATFTLSSVRFIPAAVSGRIEFGVFITNNQNFEELFAGDTFALVFSDASEDFTMTIDNDITPPAQGNSYPFYANRLYDPLVHISVKNGIEPYTITVAGGPVADDLPADIMYLAVGGVDINDEEGREALQAFEDRGAFEDIELRIREPQAPGNTASIIIGLRTFSCTITATDSSSGPQEESRTLTFTITDPATDLVVTTEISVSEKEGGSGTSDDPYQVPVDAFLSTTVRFMGAMSLRVSISGMISINDSMDGSISSDNVMIDEGVDGVGPFWMLRVTNEDPANSIFTNTLPLTSGDYHISIPYTANAPGQADISGTVDLYYKTLLRFSDTAATITDKNYRLGEAITAITLPEAVGGKHPLTYEIVDSNNMDEEAIGLYLDGRVLSGTPSRILGSAVFTETQTSGGRPTVTYTHTYKTYTYVVKDSDEITQTQSLSVRLRVFAPLIFVTTGNNIATIPNESYRLGDTFNTLTLPAVQNGNPPLTYSIEPSPEIIGLSFYEQYLELRGGTLTIPSQGAPGTEFTYRITDTAADPTGAEEIVLRFHIYVEDTVGPKFMDSDKTIAPQTYTQGNPIDTLTLPKAEGGNLPLVYSLSAQLPTGLRFDAINREISGTPTDEQDTFRYTYTITDGDGDEDTISFLLTVRRNLLPTRTEPDSIPALRYIKGIPITPITLPGAIGGDLPLSYSIIDIPSGLVLHPTDRVLSGTPTEEVIETSFIYRATDSYNDDEFDLPFVMEVKNEPFFTADDTIPPLTFIQNNEVSYPLPSATSGNEPLSYSVEPTLPDGLSVAHDSGILSGRPSVASDNTLYTYRVTDDDNDNDNDNDATLVTTLTFTLEILRDSRPTFAADASIPAQEYVKNNEIKTITLPQATGGNTPIWYYISPDKIVPDANADADAVADLRANFRPDLPSGVSFNPETRALSGNPTALFAEQTLTYRAQDADYEEPDSLIEFILFVEEESLPVFNDEYSIEARTYVQGQAIENLTLAEAITDSGNQPLTYSLFPLVPGLTFDPETRVLSGIPSVSRSTPLNQEYRVTDRDGDIDFRNFTITVNPNPVPSFDGVVIPPQFFLIPQVTGDSVQTATLPPAYILGNDILTYKVVPMPGPSVELPGWLDFNPNTRVLTATLTLSNTPHDATYIYTATDAGTINDDGTSYRDEVSITFRIVTNTDVTPTFGSETIDDQHWIVQETIAGITLPEATGGNGMLVYDLSPTLPANLVFDSDMRVISGTLTRALLPTSYTYTATDADGDSVPLYFQFTVVGNLIPQFEDDAAIPDQVYAVGGRIVSITLPEAIGGNLPLRYSIGDDPVAVLPPDLVGLSLDQSTRVLSGILTGSPAGTTELPVTQEYLYNVYDRDDSSHSIRFSITFNVNTAPRFPSSFKNLFAPGADTPTCVGGVEGYRCYYNHTTAEAQYPAPLPAAEGGNGTLVYSLHPPLPTSLYFDPERRLIYGNLTNVNVFGTYLEYTYTVTDQDGDSDSVRFFIRAQRTGIERGAPRFPNRAGVPIEGATIIIKRGQILDRTLSSAMTLELPSLREGQNVDDPNLSPPLTFRIVEELPKGLEVIRRSEKVPRTFVVESASPNIEEGATTTEPKTVTIMVDRPFNALGGTVAEDAELGNRTYTWLVENSASPTQTDAILFNINVLEGNLPKSIRFVDENGVRVTIDPDTLLYTELSYTENVQIANYTLPEAKGGAEGSTFSYGISLVLPTGLSFDQTTRHIYGTPSSVAAGVVGVVTLTYTAVDNTSTNNRAALLFKISIENDTRPDFGDESIGALVFTQNTFHEETLPSPGSVDADPLHDTVDKPNLPYAYNISPQLPEGLRFQIFSDPDNGDSTNVSINGIPTELQPTISYTYQVTDRDGDSRTLPFTLEVIPSAVSISVSTGLSSKLSDDSNNNIAPGDSRNPWLLPDVTQVLATLTVTGGIPPYNVSASSAANTVVVIPAVGDGPFALQFAESDELELLHGSAVDVSVTVSDATPTNDPPDGSADASVILNYEYTGGTELPQQNYTYTSTARGEGTESDPWLVKPDATELARLELPSDSASAQISFSYETTSNNGVIEIEFNETNNRFVFADGITPSFGDFNVTHTITASQHQYTDVIQTRTLYFRINEVPMFLEDANIPAQTYPLAVDVSYLMPEAIGGNDSSYYIEPELPLGLSFDAEQRRIRGIPEQRQEESTYTYIVGDAQPEDTDTLQFTITIGLGEEANAPSFSTDSLADLILVQNQSIEITLPQASGGFGALNYSISPLLPAGVSLALNNTPVLRGAGRYNPQSARRYVYYVSDQNDLRAALPFNIEIQEPSRPDFGNEEIPALTYTSGQSMPPYTLPPATGGNGELSYSLTPTLSLPGLNFESASRAITGMATGGTEQVDYTYTATDVDGDTTTLMFTLAVVRGTGRPTFAADATISPLMFNVNLPLPVTLLPFPEAAGDEPLVYTVADLPNGLVFNSDTRLIEGMPTALQGATTYTYSVTDDDGDTGSGVLEFTLEIIEPDRTMVPRVHVEAPGRVAPFTVSEGETLSVHFRVDRPTVEPLDIAYTISETGGFVMPQEDIVTIATGARLVALDLPLSNQEQITADSHITITVVAADESQAITDDSYELGDPYRLTVAVLDLPLSIEFSVPHQQYRLQREARLWLPSGRGGLRPYRYALRPRLPNGLIFNAEQRTISGTPTALLGRNPPTAPLPAFIYTVTDATNTPVTLTFTMEVLGAGPGVGSVPWFTPEAAAGLEDLFLARSRAITERIILPEAIGGNPPLRYSITPALSNGLTFTASTRLLSGTPLGIPQITQYTYQVTDDDGDYSQLEFSISIAAKFSISFAVINATVADQYYILNRDISDDKLNIVLPEVFGGLAPITYSLGPVLPAGIDFNPSTRQLSGTPTAPTEVEVTYTATDSDVPDAFAGSNSASITFMMTVRRSQVPNFGARTMIEDQDYTENSSVVLTLPEAFSGDLPISYLLEPAELPSGLSFDPIERTISGFARPLTQPRRYTYIVYDRDESRAELPFMLGIRRDSVPEFIRLKNSATSPPFGPSDYERRTIADIEIMRGRSLAPMILPEAINGNGKLIYSLLPEVPPGLNFEPESRRLLGTPLPPSINQQYIYKLTYHVRDRENDSDTIEFTLRVMSNQKPSFGNATVPHQRHYSHQDVYLSLPPAFGGDGSLTYSVSNLANIGALIFDRDTLEITGTYRLRVGITMVATYTATDVNDDSISLPIHFTSLSSREIRFVEASRFRRFNRTIGDLVLSRNVAVSDSNHTFTRGPGVSNSTIKGELTLPMPYPAAPGDGETPLDLSYTIEPALPNGLHLATRTVGDNLAATIIGTPIGEPLYREYTLTVTTGRYRRLVDIDGKFLSNHTQTEGERASQTFSIAVIGNSHNITIPDVAPQTWVQDREIDPPLTLPVAQTSGSQTITYEFINPPTGLSFDAPARTLSGTPTEHHVATDYLYIATAANGIAATTYITITIQPKVEFDSSDTQASIPAIELNDRQAVPDTIGPFPEPSRGISPYSYHIGGQLPGGVTFDEANRRLTGTPELPMPQTAYTYIVTDQNNTTDTLGFSLTVLDSSPMFADNASIAEISLTQYEAVPADTPVLPPAEGIELTYSLELISGSLLPEGLVFDADNRRLTGTPLMSLSKTSYAYVASDVPGRSATLFSAITVVAFSPDAQYYFDSTPIDDIVLFISEQVSEANLRNLKALTRQDALLESLMGTDFKLEYAITPDHFSSTGFNGLTLEQDFKNASDPPYLSGSPERLQERTSYILSANKVNERDNVIDKVYDRLLFDLTVVRKPLFEDDVADITLTQYQALPNTILPAATGGDPPADYTIEYEIEPSLPEGLSFDSQTRQLSGVVQNTLDETAYTYIAEDAVGEDDTRIFSITITAHEQDGSINFGEQTIDDLVFGTGVDINHSLPVVSGGSSAPRYAIIPTVMADFVNFNELGDSHAPSYLNGLNYYRQVPYFIGTPTSALPETRFIYIAFLPNNNNRVLDTLEFNLSLVNVKFPAGASISDIQSSRHSAIPTTTLPLAIGDPDVLRYHIEGANVDVQLPLGIVFDTQTRVLSGTPRNATSGDSTYTYVATYDENERDTLTFSLVVNDGAVQLTYQFQPRTGPDLEFVINVGISGSVPLPLLSHREENGPDFADSVANGGKGYPPLFIVTPSRKSDSDEPYYTLVNGAVSDEVDDAIIAAFEMQGDDAMHPGYLKGITLRQQAPNGVAAFLSGMPTELLARTEFLLTAIDRGTPSGNARYGTGRTFIDAVPFFFSISALRFEDSDTIPDITLSQYKQAPEGAEATTFPEATGGNGAQFSYGIEPNLPGLLSFDQATRQIRGMPLESAALTTYTYIAIDTSVEVAEGGTPEQARLTFRLTITDHTIAFPSDSMTALSGILFESLDKELPKVSNHDELVSEPGINFRYLIARADMPGEPDSRYGYADTWVKFIDNQEIYFDQQSESESVPAPRLVTQASSNHSLVNVTRPWRQTDYILYAYIIGDPSGNGGDPSGNGDILLDELSFSFVVDTMEYGLNRNIHVPSLTVNVGLQILTPFISNHETLDDNGLTPYYIFTRVEVNSMTADAKGMLRTDTIGNASIDLSSLHPNLAGISLGQRPGILGPGILGPGISGTPTMELPITQFIYSAVLFGNQGSDNWDCWVIDAQTFSFTILNPIGSFGTGSISDQMYTVGDNIIRIDLPKIFAAPTVTDLADIRYAITPTDSVSGFNFLSANAPLQDSGGMNVGGDNGLRIHQPAGEAAPYIYSYSTLTRYFPRTRFIYSAVLPDFVRKGNHVVLATLTFTITILPKQEDRLFDDRVTYPEAITLTQYEYVSSKNIRFPAFAGDNYSYAFKPSLPPGITFEPIRIADKHYQRLSGAPTESSSSALYNYIVTRYDNDPTPKELVHPLPFTLEVQAANPDNSNFGEQSIGNLRLIAGVEQDIALPLLMPPPDFSTRVIQYQVSPRFPNTGLSIDSARLVGTALGPQERTEYLYYAADMTNPDPDETIVLDGIVFSLTVADPLIFDPNTIADLFYVENQRGIIPDVSLPSATGGYPEYRYEVTPGLPMGIGFDSGVRILRLSDSGALSAYSARHTYTVTDGEGYTAALSFNLTVYPPAQGTLSLNVVVGESAGGDGSAENPYPVFTSRQLLATFSSTGGNPPYDLGVMDSSHEVRLLATGDVGAGAGELRFAEPRQISADAMMGTEYQITMRLSDALGRVITPQLHYEFAGFENQTNTLYLPFIESYEFIYRVNAIEFEKELEPLNDLPQNASGGTPLPLTTPSPSASGPPPSDSRYTYSISLKTEDDLPDNLRNDGFTLTTANVRELITERARSAKTGTPSITAFVYTVTDANNDSVSQEFRVIVYRRAFAEIYANRRFGTDTTKYYHDDIIQTTVQSLVISVVVDRATLDNGSYTIYSSTDGGPVLFNSNTDLSRTFEVMSPDKVGTLRITFNTGISFISTGTSVIGMELLNSGFTTIDKIEMAIHFSHKTVVPAPTTTPAPDLGPTLDICARTDQVRDYLLLLFGYPPGAAGYCSMVPVAAMNEITALPLQHHHITAIKVGDFAAMPALTTLHLNNNQLTTLPEDIFSSLPPAQQEIITHLDLSHNQITDLPADIFNGLNQLQELNLSNNQLTAFPETLFNGLESLITLHLNDNQLASDILPDRIFQVMDNPETPEMETLNLETLNLSNSTADGSNIKIKVRLEAIEKDNLSRPQIRVTIDTAAPFTMTYSFTRNNRTNADLAVGSGTPISRTYSETEELTIKAGQVHSNPLSVIIHTRDGEDTPQVTIDRLPDLPSGHSGYTLELVLGTLRFFDAPDFREDRIPDLIDEKSPIMCQPLSMYPGLVTLPQARSDLGISYSFKPSLPRGLSFNPITRVLSGTPMSHPGLGPECRSDTYVQRREYKYIATDSLKLTATLTFMLEVQPNTAPVFNQPTAHYVLHQNAAVHRSGDAHYGLLSSGRRGNPLSVVYTEEGALGAGLTNDGIDILGPTGGNYPLTFSISPSLSEGHVPRAFSTLGLSQELPKQLRNYPMLPDGVVLNIHESVWNNNPTGKLMITGTPTGITNDDTPAEAFGTFTYTYTATDRTGESASYEFTIRVIENTTPEFKSSTPDLEYHAQARQSLNYVLPLATGNELTADNGLSPPFRPYSLRYTLQVGRDVIRPNSTSDLLPGGVRFVAESNTDDAGKTTTSYRITSEVSEDNVITNPARADFRYTWTVRDVQGQTATTNFQFKAILGFVQDFGGYTHAGERIIEYYFTERHKRDNVYANYTLPPAFGGWGELTYTLDETDQQGNVYDNPPPPNNGLLPGVSFISDNSDPNVRRLHGELRSPHVEFAFGGGAKRGTRYYRYQATDRAGRTVEQQISIIYQRYNYDDYAHICFNNPGRNVSVEDHRDIINAVYYDERLTVGKYFQRDLSKGFCGGGTVPLTFSLSGPGGSDVLNVLKAIGLNFHQYSGVLAGTPIGVLGPTEVIFSITDSSRDRYGNPTPETVTASFILSVSLNRIVAFGDGVTIDNQFIDQDRAMQTIILPRAIDGNAPVTHKLTGDTDFSTAPTLSRGKFSSEDEGKDIFPSGIEYHAAGASFISGTFNANNVDGIATYTWTATDNDGDSATLTFSLEFRYRRHRIISKTWNPSGALDTTGRIRPSRTSDRNPVTEIPLEFENVHTHGTPAVVRVGIYFDITHSFADYLRIQLTSPDGTTITLLEPREGRNRFSLCSRGYKVTINEDMAEPLVLDNHECPGRNAQITNASVAPGNPGYNLCGALDGFYGGTPHGTWTFGVTNTEGGADYGTIHSVTITLITTSRTGYRNNDLSPPRTPPNRTPHPRCRR